MAAPAKPQATTIIATLAKGIRGDEAQHQKATFDPRPI